MNKIYAFVRHNSGILGSIFLAVMMIVYAYGCQSVVVSLITPGQKINRDELVAEVDMFLARAESRFADLDRQDLVKETIFNSLTDFIKTGSVNPIGIITTITGILGAGAVVDNVRKRTHINTLKGGSANARKTEGIQTGSPGENTKADT